MDFLETINPLIGVVDGTNRTFTIAERFELGTPRAIVNGVVYEPSDEYFGYAELNSYTIRFTHAPKVGYRLYLFYRVAVAEGSPFSGSPTLITAVPIPAIFVRLS